MANCFSITNLIKRRVSARLNDDNATNSCDLKVDIENDEFKFQKIKKIQHENILNVKECSINDFRFENEIKGNQEISKQGNIPRKP